MSGPRSNKASRFRTQRRTAQKTRATVVQVTNLGLTVKDSPQNTLVFVTRLDDAAPVEGARVSIVTLDNKVAWTGSTNADGVAIAPALPLRTPQRWFDVKFEFLVVVEKDGDTAYLGSDWTEGITPWEFGSDLDLSEQNSLLRGTVFADRGVYRLGEEVHFKAILRNDTPTGIKVPDAGTQVYVMVRDSQDREVDQRTVRLSAWGSAEWTETLPGDGALGNYSVIMRLRPFHEPAPKPSTQLVRELGVEGEVQSEEPGAEPRDSVSGGFLVAAYRRPDFRVDATLTSAAPFAGAPLSGHVSARYLFGAPMKNAPIRWTFTRSAAWGAPATLTNKFPQDGFDFGITPTYCGPHRTESRRRRDRRRWLVRGRARRPPLATAFGTSTRSKAKSPMCRDSGSRTGRPSPSTLRRCMWASSCPTSWINRRAPRPHLSR